MIGFVLGAAWLQHKGPEWNISGDSGRLKDSGYRPGSMTVIGQKKKELIV